MGFFIGIILGYCCNSQWLYFLSNVAYLLQMFFFFVLFFPRNETVKNLAAFTLSVIDQLIISNSFCMALLQYTFFGVNTK